MSPLSPRDTDRQTERHADTLSKHKCSHLCRSHQPDGEAGAPSRTKPNQTKPKLSIAILMPSDVRRLKQKDLHKFFEDFQQLWPTEGTRQQVEPAKWSWSAGFLICRGQKSVAVMINKRPVIAALLCRPDCTFTLSLWGRPNDFYLPPRKHIKAISDCGSPSVFDHTAAVLAEAWLVSLGSSFCSLCKQKEALRKSSWLIPFASIPSLKAVRRLPGKPNMTAKAKHDSARRRTRHSWGIEHRGWNRF